MVFPLLVVDHRHRPLTAALFRAFVAPSYLSHATFLLLGGGDVCIEKGGMDFEGTGQAKKKRVGMDGISEGRQQKNLCVCPNKWFSKRIS